ncbi:TonB-dependent receptor [Photobacterium japonica]|uniref:TonB-dependent receptor n=1 Tax=Photobacterium japonica TaxID=2910235 RepID=UPI003D0D6278
MKRYLLLLLAALSSSANATSFSLPIWKEKAEALGYELPKPIGFSLGYMSMEQGINVDSIHLQDAPVLDFLKIGMEADKGMQKTDVLSFRADMWLFPFLNVYAMVGKLDGYSQVDVTPTRKGEPLNVSFPFKLDLEGYTKGVGIVLAGGHEQWFGLVDASFSQSTLTVIDGEINAWVISPRIGYDFASHGMPLRVWAGAMYQDVEQSLSGKMSDVAKLDKLDFLIPKDATFHVEQHLTTPWNPLLGMQYTVNRDWNLLGEVGLGDRQSLFVSLERRF